MPLLALSAIPTRRVPLTSGSARFSGRISALPTLICSVAGAEVNGAAATHLGPLDAGVGGGLSLGIGAEGTANASLSADKIGFQLKGGLTLGVGFNVNLNVSVNPKELVSDVKDVGSSAVHAIGDAGSAVKHFFGF